MRITIFDVSNGSCALVMDKNGNSIMIDCWANGDKGCPVDLITGWKNSNHPWALEMKAYNHSWYTYPLTMLLITHPDLDHIKNIKKVHSHVTPLLLHRQYLSHFNEDEVENDSEHFQFYKKIDSDYNQGLTTLPFSVDWGFDFHKHYLIPIQTLRQNWIWKIKNNSSVVSIFRDNGFSILFWWDMEEEGWNILIDNNIDWFRDELEKWIDVLIAPHHWHHSWYSAKLFEKIKPKITILSKWSEEWDESDVSPNYSRNSTWEYYIRNLQEVLVWQRSTLTTRNDGNIFLNTSYNWELWLFISNQSI